MLTAGPEPVESTPRQKPHLHDDVQQPLPPLHVPRAHQRKRDRRVEVRAADVRKGVDDRHQREAVGGGRGRVLGGRGAAEDLEEHHPHELRDELPDELVLDLAGLVEDLLDVATVGACGVGLGEAVHLGGGELLLVKHACSQILYLLQQRAPSE